MLWSRIIVESNTAYDQCSDSNNLKRSDHDQRHRACGEDSERSVQDRKVIGQTQNCSRDLGGYSRRLTCARSFLDADRTLAEFAPEPLKQERKRLVEAAGVEPASEKARHAKTTCVSD